MFLNFVCSCHSSVSWVNEGSKYARYSSGIHSQFVVHSAHSNSTPRENRPLFKIRALKYIPGHKKMLTCFADWYQQIKRGKCCPTRTRSHPGGRQLSHCGDNRCSVAGDFPEITSSCHALCPALSQLYGPENYCKCNKFSAIN